MHKQHVISRIPYETGSLPHLTQASAGALWIALPASDDVSGVPSLLRFDEIDGRYEPPALAPDRWQDSIPNPPANRIPGDPKELRGLSDCEQGLIAFVQHRRSSRDPMTRGVRAWEAVVHIE